MIDQCEDNSRIKSKFKRNPYGSKHSASSQLTQHASADRTEDSPFKISNSPEKDSVLTKSTNDDSSRKM